jgi:DegV family protein with EDD domain
MSKIAVITDSTAYIPKDLVQKHNLTVMPQVLIWGSETLRDGVDIQPKEFYIRLKSVSILPTTSQVTIGAFKETFDQLLGEGYEILAVLLSSKLSGTIDSAVQAKAMLPAGAPVEIVDSQTTAMALGFPAIEAARLAAKGGSLKECKELAMRACQQTGLVFAVDTLEFLHRGGRIGGASRFLATALNIKPILELENGKVEAIERVRTRSRSLARLVELIEERVNGRKGIHLATLHANAEEDARQLLAMAQGRLDIVETVLAEVSPVVGNHAGPGTVGLAFMADPR